MNKAELIARQLATGGEWGAVTGTEIFPPSRPLNKAELVASQLAAAEKDKGIWGKIHYNFKDYKGNGDGETDNTGALNALIAEIGAKEASIILAGGVFYIGGAVTVPDNITLTFIRGGRLKLAIGIEIEINGGIEAQAACWIFDISLGGKVTGAPKLNVTYPEWLGARGDDVTDCTVAIQTAINLCASAEIGTVQFLKGSYRLTSVNKRSNVTLKGVSSRKTILKALPSTQKGLITGDYAQPIDRACISTMTIEGGWINPDQNGLHFDAIQQIEFPHTGGLWYSRFDDLRISGFLGHSIYLRAINIDGDVANQFLVFNNVTAYRNPNSTTSRALKATGQLGQVTFTNCEFSTTVGGVKVPGTNVELRRDDVPGTVYTGFEADQCPNAVKFITCTFQNSEKAVHIDRCANINFDNGWFENVAKSITIVTTARAIVVENSHFANAASDGSGGGYGVGVFGSSFAVVENNYFFGAVDRIVSCDNHKGVRMRGNQTDGFTGSSLTAGYSRQMNVAVDGSISTDYLQDVLLNGTTILLNKIYTKLHAGETFNIRAWGLGKYVKIDRSGNISIRNPLYLKHGEVATFGVTDLGDTGRVVYFISTSQRELETSDIDADATNVFFHAGEQVKNRVATSGGYAGWVCIKEGKYHSSLSRATTTSGSPIITINDPVTYAWAVGDAISGSGIPAGTTITEVSGTTVTLSQSCTITNTTSIPISDAVFKPYGLIT